MEFCRGGRCLRYDNAFIWNYIYDKIYSKMKLCHGIHSVSLSRDGNMVLTCLSGGVYIYNNDSNKMDSLPDSNNIRDATFSPNGKYIACLLDDHIKIWNIKKKELVLKWKENDSKLILYDSSGRYILSGYKHLVIREASTGKIKCRLEDINETLVGSTYEEVSFSQDGKYIIAVRKGNIYIWDAESGLLIQKIGEHILSAEFNPEGNEILYSTYDEIRVMDFPPLQQLIDETRKRFKNRSLTPEERMKYYLE